MSATSRRSRSSPAAAEATGESSPAAAAHWFAAALRLVPDGDARARADLLAPRGACAGRRRAARRGARRRCSRRSRSRRSARARDRRSRASRATSACTRDARRRLLAARADAPPERRAHARGRARRAAPSTRAASPSCGAGRIRPSRPTQDDPLLLTGAEALAALGALWDGEPARGRAAAGLARPSGWTRSPTTALGHVPRDRVLRRDRPAALRALRGGRRDDRPRARARPPDRPGRAARDAARGARDGAAAAARARRRGRRGGGGRGRAPACRASRTCCTSRSGSARSSTTCAARRPRPSAPSTRARA